jgi:hypothetical protein
MQKKTYGVWEQVFQCQGEIISKMDMNNLYYEWSGSGILMYEMNKG